MLSVRAIEMELCRRRRRREREPWLQDVVAVPVVDRDVWKCHSEHGQNFDWLPREREKRRVGRRTLVYSAVSLPVVICSRGETSMTPSSLGDQSHWCVRWMIYFDMRIIQMESRRQHSPHTDQLTLAFVYAIPVFDGFANQKRNKKWNKGCAILT